MQKSLSIKSIPAFFEVDQNIVQELIEKIDMGTLVLGTFILLVVTYVIGSLFERMGPKRLFEGWGPKGHTAPLPHRRPSKGAVPSPFANV